MTGFEPRTSEATALPQPLPYFMQVGHSNREGKWASDSFFCDIKFSVGAKISINIWRDREKRKQRMAQ